MKYVIGMLMLASLSTQAYGADKKTEAKGKVKAPAESAQTGSRSPASVEKEQVDELEKVLQSTYDYNNNQMELGDATGR